MNGIHKGIVIIMPETQNPTIAVLLPCYNEEVTIGKVVRDFKATLPTPISTYTITTPLTVLLKSQQPKEQSSEKSRVKAREM